jgi:hypothetical protein
MSIKKYFEVAENIQSLSNKSAHEIAAQVESAGYHEQDLIQEERFISRVDFSKPQNFARWGSAEEYYNQALKRIYEGYPYDGSLRERSEWHNESIDIDLYVFENRYPRTTGYGILSADGWGTGNLVDGYGVPATPEYIYVKGGPNPHQVKETPYTIQFTGSNYYEPSKNRGSNLSLNLASNGASLEFWLKKSAYLEESPREVIFDLWNGENSSSADYARFRLELTGNLTDGSTPFLLTAMSGTTGFYRQNISSTSITSASVGNDTWQHYAVTLKSASAGVTTRFYVNGALDKESTLGSTGINDVDSTALRAYAGALVTAVSGTTTPSSTKAADGKLSASLDEFRYWKVQRTSEEIGRFWFTQVGGGVNTDPIPFTTTEESSNVNLGVYFKFNEGITGRAATDSVVLDYSGRWSNGAWTGYTSNSRNTGSAIISSSAAVREFEDPIIYSFHPRVELLSTQLQLSGSTYDVNNNASLYKTIPSWISEEDEEGSGDVKNLTQILSSYFDSLHLKIESLNKLKDIRYLSGSAEKPLPFAEKLLSNYGLVAPDLFLDADILEKLLDRSEDKVYEKSLHDIKNIIYQNIYNNLNYIYKSKGTEKSFRNLIRCFGIDDELVKINMYANDVTYELQNNRRNVVVADKLVNFNNSDNTKATVYNYADPTNSNSVSYIDANSSLTGGFSTTLETEVLFPLKISEDSPSYVNTNTISSSLFGVHGTTLSATKTTWPGDDTVNFQVYAVRDELHSDNVKFVLTSSTGGYIPKLSSNLYQQVYNNTRWNLAVRIKPETYPMKGLINSASSNYVVELHGIQAEAGVILEEFTVSASVIAPRPSFVTGSKRVFIGAHRSNFTGSTLLDKSDVKVNACRYWLDYIDDEALRGHILDTENHGALQPHLYAFEFDTSASYGDVTKYDTLVFNWEFLTNTGSSAGGTFMVDDLSSGSADFTRFGSLGGILNKQYTASGSFFLPSSTKSIDKDFVISSKLNLPENVRAEDMVKVLNAQEQDVFTTESRPVNYYFAFEKSMYQVISEEILNSFANLKDFHNLIGDVVEQYRPEYKQLAFMRQKFFENVANQELDFEKFYEYYKWFDSSLSLMLGQLVPASADFSNNVRTMVENHVLERPKYRNKFPILQRKGGNDITGAVEGGGDGTAMGSPDDFPQGSLLFANTSLTKRQIGSSRTPQINSWKHFHAPIRELSLDAAAQHILDMAWRNKNIYWQRYRSGSAEPKPTVASNTVRKDLLTAIKKSYDRSVNTPVKFGAEGYVTFGGVARPPNNKPNYTFAHCSPYGPMVSGSNVPINIMVGFNEGVEELLDSPDEYYPTFKQRLGFGMNPTINIDDVDSTTAFDGNLYAPFSMYSSSVETGYNATVVTTYKSGTMLTNLHNDFVDSHDTPAQGPFTEKFVGGRFFRHTEPNAGSDTRTTRAEGFRLELGTIAPGKAGALGVVPPNYPFSDTLESELTNDAGTVLGWLKDVPIAQRFRDETAKRPLNIKNILMTTASVGTRLSGTITHNPIGNYQKNYQVISTGGRTINDPFFQDQSFNFALNPETGVLRGRPPGQFQTLTNTKSMIFDVASSQYASIGAGTIWNGIIGNGGGTGTSKMTISLWFNMDAEGATSYQRFMSFGHNDLFIDTHESPRWLRFYTYWNGAFVSWITTSAVFTEGVWNHLVWTYDATSTANNPVVYLNGTSLSLTEGGTAPAGAWYGMGSGDSGIAGGAGTNPFGGSINEVTIWDSTLSATQVTTLYTSQPTLPYNPALPTPSAWWRMGNGPNDTTSIIYDIAGTNNATPTNSPTFSNTVPTQTGLVNSELNFALPDRAGSNSNQTIIVNHFSAPGEYKTLSRGYLDPAHEELSAYNASPYRNRGVIDYGLSGSASADPSIAGSIRVVDQLGKNRGLNQLSTLHSDPYGIDSAYGVVTRPSTGTPGTTRIDGGGGYSITPSWTKTNRNPIIRFEEVTGSAGYFNIIDTTVGIGTDTVWDSLIGGAAAAAKAFTLSARFYALSTGETSAGRIFDFGNSDRGIYLIADGTLRAEIGAGIGAVTLDCSPALNKWNHVTWTYTGGLNGTTALYLNGVLSEAKTVGSPHDIDGADCYIGSYNGAYTWDGYITDAAIWERALSEVEANSLYNQGISADLLDISMYSVDTLRNNLIAWYRFDAALGDTTSNVVNRAPNPTAATDGDSNTNLVLQTQQAPLTAQKKRSYDNLYVQHAIPRNEQQYAWITASMAPYNGIYGLQRATCTSASTMSQLLTASIGYVGGDFVGLRGKIIDNVNLTTHTLGFESPAVNPYHYVSFPTPNTDGEGGYIKLGSTTDTWDDILGGAGANAKPMTISMWVYPVSGNVDGTPRLIEFGDASARRLSWENAHGGGDESISWRFRYGVDYDKAQTPSGSVPMNVWTHVVATFTGAQAGSLKIYLNGLLADEETYSGDSPNAFSGTPPILGNRYASGGYDRAFNGNIANTAIWARELNAEEVEALYNNGGRIELTNVASMRKNLLAWYRFNSDYGDSTTTADGSATATIRNQAVWDVYGSDSDIPVAATLATNNGNAAITSSVILTDNKLTSGSSGAMGLSSSAYSNAYINSNVWWEAPTFVNEHDYLNALILNRGGPYGNPTWKQIRGMDRPVVRKMRENNLIGVAIDPDSFINSAGTAQHPTRPNTFVDYYESPVENSKNPIYFYFEDNTTNSDSANNLIVTTPYGNELEHFSHEGLNTRLGLKVDLTQLNAYRSVKNFTMDSALSVLIKYSERIYPSTKNAYRKNIRGRTEYSIDNIWNNNREYRSVPLGGLSGAFVYSGSLGGSYSNIGVPTASIWPLDAHLNFATTGSALGTDGAGQLLNLYSRYSCSVGSGSGAPTTRLRKTNINAAPTYAYRTQYGWAGSTPGAPGGEDPLYMGDAPWTAADTFGKPPYEEYQSYADRIRSVGKDYSILPEFRISPLMSTYVNTHENNFLANLNNIFELTGAAVSSSVEDKFYTTYTNSDFLKYFKIVDDDLYEKRSGALKIIRDKVTLSCDALIKFLPYKGFYPAERTVELATIFSQSYGPSTSPSIASYEANNNQVFRVVAEPLFSPGILHNTVKSGLAVSNFVLTCRSTGSATNSTTNGPPNSLEVPSNTVGALAIRAGQMSDGTYSYVGLPTRDMLYAPRLPKASYSDGGGYHIQTVPFEALYDPESFFNLDTISNLSGNLPRWTGSESIPNGVIYDTAPTGSLAYLNPGTKKQVGVDLTTFRGSQTYKLAIDNFLSEVSTLFVDQFAHFKSDREENFKSVSSDNVYTMKLLLYRTKIPGSITEAPDFENFTMYNNPLGFGQALIQDNITDPWALSTAHVTPPYYGGPATVTFKYTPATGVTVPTIDEIFANTTVTYERTDIYSQESLNKRTHYARMQLSSSWNLFERLTEVPPGTVTQKSRWLLQSKMETPVLNFASAPMVLAHSASTGPFGATVAAQATANGGASPGIRGMWHQYGSIPTGSDEGVFAVISPSPQLGSAKFSATTTTPTGSLANILGFQAGVPMRIGSTRKEAKFEEAVVAVPYRVDSGIREFIKFPRITPSLVTLRAAMDKYVFPPKFDFTRFDTVDAIMMYVFEFSADLTQTDIANMWQNLPPSIATEFKTQNAVVEEKELIDSIISKTNNIEWMVFKVKKRARSDFELVRRSQVTNDLTSLQPRITTPYSYNWPYDYFSLVELAKITEGVDYISSDLKAGANISELESLDVDRTTISADFGAASYGAAYTGGGGSGGPQGAAANEVAQQSAARNNFNPQAAEITPQQTQQSTVLTLTSGKGSGQSTVLTSTSGKGSGQSTVLTSTSGNGSGQSTYSSGQSTVLASTSGKGSGQASAGSSGILSRRASFGGTTGYGSSYEGGGSQAPPPTQYPPPGSF